MSMPLSKDSKRPECHDDNFTCFVVLNWADRKQQNV